MCVYIYIYIYIQSTKINYTQNQHHTENEYTETQNNKRLVQGWHEWAGAAWKLRSKADESTKRHLSENNTTYTYVYIYIVCIHRERGR